MVKRLHLIFLRVLGGWCMTEFQKQRVPCIDFTTIFTQTYLLVVEIITYKKHQFKGTTKKHPPKTTICKKKMPWLSINRMMNFTFTFTQSLQKIQKNAWFQKFTKRLPKPTDVPPLELTKLQAKMLEETNKKFTKVQPGTLNNHFLMDVW